MCERHPSHVKDDIIIAKIMIIGRTYSASLERRRKRKIHSVGEKFYEDQVAPAVRQSAIDDWLRQLATDEKKTSALPLEIHRKLTDLFSEISGLRKRSLASKYLHFHFPERFYIYDSYAQKAVRKAVGKIMHDTVSENAERCDTPYAKFFRNCETLRKDIRVSFGLALTPRDLDKVLLKFHAADIRFPLFKK